MGNYLIAGWKQSAIDRMVGIYLNEKYEILEDNVRKHYADIVWTHKIQEKEADLLLNKYKDMELLRIIASALTSAGIIVVIFNDCFATKLISAILSFATLFVNLFLKSFNLKSMVEEHKKAANEFLEIRNNLQFLIMEIRLKEKEVENLEDEYRTILYSMNEKYRNAPQTSERAVKKAANALKCSKENSYTDGEINSFLPKSLWKDKSE